MLLIDIPLFVMFIIIPSSVVLFCSFHCLGGLDCTGVRPGAMLSSVLYSH